MSKASSSILIVGGGTAGWLTATIIASKLHKEGSSIRVSLVDAPEIPTVGVGEGTWPSMRKILHDAGIKELDFLIACDASFKQGSKFIGWKNGKEDDSYYHPFDLPYSFYEKNFAQTWVNESTNNSYSDSVTAQENSCEKNLSPKMLTSKNYSGIANYGYHLDAFKFANFLKDHCINNLNVNFIADEIVEINNQENGDIKNLKTKKTGNLEAYLYIDCTGFKSLILGGNLGVKFIDKSNILPINSALAVQMPYGHNDPIKSVTISTAQEAGWIWDIGLSSRRGVGYVYCNKFITHEKAATQLKEYLNVDDDAFERLNPKKIPIIAGYREKIWHKNCVAIGLSAGFLEPLEASAMMLIETSANAVVDNFPVNREAMDIVAKRFNQRAQYRWERIIDFLKLHYTLSKRHEPFWRFAASKATVSERLLNDLEFWQYQPPWKNDFDNTEEPFPEASYQYVLYGMDFITKKNRSKVSPENKSDYVDMLVSIERQKEMSISHAESNLLYLAKLKESP